MSASKYNRVAKSQPRYQSEGHYKVDSDDKTLVAYDVKLNSYGIWECDCYQYVKHYECKHVNAVLVLEAVVMRDQETTTVTVEQAAVMQQWDSERAPKRSTVALESLFV